MTNVKIEQKGDLLVLTIDASKVLRDAALPSKSGKNRVLGTTHGFTNYNGVGISLNATVR